MNSVRIGHSIDHELLATGDTREKESSVDDVVLDEVQPKLAVILQLLLDRQRHQRHRLIGRRYERVLWQRKGINFSYRFSLGFRDWVSKLSI